jgi:Fe-S oxidoreductase/nitrate reductase gamma subunit
LNPLLLTTLPTRELLFGVKDSVVLTLHYALFALAAIVFLVGVYKWYRFVSTGRRDEERLDNLGSRIWLMLKDGFAFVRLYVREAKMGIMHILLLWGFILLFIGTLILTVAERSPVNFFKGTFYLVHEFLMDTAGIAFLLGLAIAIANRYGLKPSRFEKRWERANDDGLVLILLVVIGILGFLVEGMRIAIGIEAYTAYIGAVLGSILPWDLTAYRFLWSAHSILALIFIAVLPFTKLAHIIAAPLNILTRSNRHPGAARGIEDEEYMGAIEAKDLQWRDLLSSLACMRCGRCQDACPATNSNTTLSPMHLMQNLRYMGNTAFGFLGNLKEDQDTMLLDNVLDMEAVWACTTCRACMEMCPVYIEQMEIIQEMRRGVVESGEAPPDIRDLLTNITKQRNPWGEAKYKRDAWAKDVGVPKVKDNPEFEWLWWVGCAHSFDNRNKPIAVKIAQILEEIGVNYATLGREEGCCGNDVRRVGEEGLFQMLKEENEAAFQKYGVERIIATSPHCFNTFKNEYEGYNVRFLLEVIYEAIKDGRIRFKKPINRKVTFHDPCYLGRYNGMYELPREILKAIPGIELVEMPRNRERSFCCGAGGGNLVREYPGDDRPNNIRAREAAETGADVLAVACPFCMIMLEDGVKSVGVDDRLEVLDVIELVWESAFSEE